MKIAKIIKAMHFADNYIINPTNAITVNLIGAGGTGSRMLTELARMNHSLIALGHPGLQLNLYDDDIVTIANQGRQLFADAEVGLPKAVALINRTNRFFGTNWKAITRQFTKSNARLLPNNGRANIFISCVDTVKARFEIAEVLQGLYSCESNQRDKCLYWMDLGNSRFSGQCILSTVNTIDQPNSKLYMPVGILPFVTEEFSSELNAQVDNDEPSCSLAEALEKQDLYINAVLASMSSALLWKLFREGMTEERGFFLNLKTFNSQPLKCK